METLEEMTAACRLLDAVWEIAPDEVSEVRPSLLRGLGHGGNYLAAAYRSEGPGAGEMVGASVAFFAEPLGRAMHSHITGVRSGGAGRGVGAAIKWHQRAWALDRGLDLVRWTYDPLIARNSFFNLTRLGARPGRYHVDFYGPMDDGPNRGQPTDRVDVLWELDSASTSRAAEAVLDPSAATDGPDVDALRAAGAAVVLSVGSSGEPVPADPAAARQLPIGPPVLIGVPADIEAIRRADPGQALRWRLALRAVLVELMADDGRRVTGFAKSGWYVVQPSGTVQPSGAVRRSGTGSETNGGGG